MILRNAVRQTRIECPVVGLLTEIDEDGMAHVKHGDAEPIPARSVVALALDQVGREVVLQFEGGDVKKPIVMGVLQPAQPNAVPVKLDGDSLQLTAEREVVLRCGKASLTLTKAGKVLLRGKYILSRSSGVNRIKGGSVEIN